MPRTRAKTKSPPAPAITPPAATPDKLAIANRLAQQGIWSEVAVLRDGMMREARKAGLSKDQAQSWVYTELDRLYPAPETAIEDETLETVHATDEPPLTTHDVTPTENTPSVAITGDTPTGENTGERGAGNDRVLTAAEAVLVHAREVAERGKLRGLDAIPESWPTLPASANLVAELGWVQSNRLAVVSESGQQTRVDLSRAGEPAPSRSAIAWLETSIRNYSKYTDVAARALAGGSDEGEDVRREKVALHDIERLLGEMAETV